MLTKLWNKLCRLCTGSHQPCSRCDLLLKLTGESPANASESLVGRIMANRPDIGFHALERQISHALYDDELKMGAHALDLGIAGPGLFIEEASKILEQVRPEFAVLTHNGTAASPAAPTRPARSAPEEREV